MSPPNEAILCPLPGITAMAGGCNVTLADGLVRFISQSLDFAVFRTLSMRAGGEGLDGRRVAAGRSERR